MPARLGGRDEVVEDSFRDRYVPGIKILSRDSVQLDRPMQAMIRVTSMATTHYNCSSNVVNSKSFCFGKELLLDRGLGKCFEPWFERVEGWVVPINVWKGADFDADVDGRESWRSLVD